jgi:hypothetical protein
MANLLPLTNFLLIPGMILLVVAVVGKSRFGFSEINSGVWGRFFALFLGVACLMIGLAEMPKSLPLSIFLLIAGITFLLIAVIGQSKFSFAEINPGLWGRVLALLLSVACFMVALA